MSRPLRAPGNLCIKCDRSLQDSFLFCSLFCKVFLSSKQNFINKFYFFLLFCILKFLLIFFCNLQVTMKNGTHLGKFDSCEFLRLPNRMKSQSFAELGDNQNVHDSGPDSSVSQPRSPSCTNGGVSSVTFRTILSCSAATKFVKKKRSSLNSVPRVFSRQICSPADDVSVAMNRRKGIPYRSPLS